MSEYIRHEGLPLNMKVLCTGDWHCGARAYNEGAAQYVIERLKRERNTYMLFLGDAIEGKKIDSPHFDPSTLREGQTNIHSQYSYIRELWRPVAKKILANNVGNHDWYLAKNFDWHLELCRELEIPRGGYQTVVEIHPGLRVFMFHGWRGAPKGAKDPIQRDANRRAWLKRELEDMNGSCHVMLMGHTHLLLLQPPIEQNTLLHYAEGDVRMASFVEPQQVVETEHGALPWVPASARWYGNTGTFRRSGGFGYIDYAEMAGYAPSPMGFLEMTVKGGVCVDIKKVIL